MKTILITGINGFLGSNLAKKLSSDYNIIGLEYSLDELNRIKDFSFQVYSIKKDLEQIFSENNIFAVIHAATIYRRSNTETLESLIKTNILLPVKIYELAEKYNSKIFLNTDTFFNNSECNYNYLPDYTLSKGQVIEWLKLISVNCKLVNMKIFHMYGANDAKNKFIPQMISAMVNNVPSLDLTPGDQSRDFIYIDDVVDAYSHVLNNEPFLKNEYQEFQVGTGNGVKINVFLKEIKKITKSQTRLNFSVLPYRDNEIMYSCADNSGLKKLGWNYKFDINRGLRQLLK